MSCVCETYQCLEALWACGSEGVQVNVIATQTGDWRGIIYFEGVPTVFDFGVETGEKIIIPTEFLNEFYTHELHLFNTLGNLIGCYHLKSRRTNNAGSFTPILPGTNTMDGDVFDGNGTDTQTFPGIGEVLEITIGFQVYPQGTFVQVEEDGELTEEIIMNDGVSFSGKIIIKWRRLS